jgi:hypothetical protein
MSSIEEVREKFSAPFSLFSTPEEIDAFMEKKHSEEQALKDKLEGVQGSIKQIEAQLKYEDLCLTGERLKIELKTKKEEMDNAPPGSNNAMKKLKHNLVMVFVMENNKEKDLYRQQFDKSVPNPKKVLKRLLVERKELEKEINSTVHYQFFSHSPATPEEWKRIEGL